MRVDGACWWSSRVQSNRVPFHMRSSVVITQLSDQWLHHSYRKGNWCTVEFKHGGPILQFPRWNELGSISIPDLAQSRTSRWFSANFQHSYKCHKSKVLYKCLFWHLLCRNSDVNYSYIYIPTFLAKGKAWRMSRS